MLNRAGRQFLRNEISTVVIHQGQAIFLVDKSSTLGG
jgi:hypothetical protein